MFGPSWTKSWNRSWGGSAIRRLLCTVNCCELELYRAHTPRTASTACSIWLRLYSSNVCWQPLRIMLGHAVMHVQKAHGPLGRCGRQVWTKMHYLWCSWPVSNDLKHIYWVQFFSTILTDPFAYKSLWCPVCRSSKQAIFIPMTTTDILYMYKPIALPLAHARGVMIRM